MLTSLAGRRFVVDFVGEAVNALVKMHWLVLVAYSAMAMSQERTFALVMM